MSSSIFESPRRITCIIFLYWIGSIFSRLHKVTKRPFWIATPQSKRHFSYLCSLLVHFSHSHATNWAEYRYSSPDVIVSPLQEVGSPCWPLLASSPQPSPPFSSPSFAFPPLWPFKLPSYPRRSLLHWFGHVSAVKLIKLLSLYYTIYPVCFASERVKIAAGSRWWLLGKAGGSTWHGLESPTILLPWLSFAIT